MSEAGPLSSSGPRGWPFLAATPGHTTQQPPSLDEVIEQAADREELLLQALRIAGVGGWELDIESGILSWSEETFRILGLDPALHRPSNDLFYSLVHPEDRQRMLWEQTHSHQAGSIFNQEYRIIRPDGELRHLNSRAQVVPRGPQRHNRFLGVVQDITERRLFEQKLEAERAIARQLQADLVHISRVSAMGAMASALAHELNQPLTAIMNYSAALKTLSTGSGEAGVGGIAAESLPPMVDAIARNAHRAGDIIRRLRTMTSRREVHKSAIELAPCLSEAADLALTGANLAVTWDVDPEIRVEADRVQLQQVIVNLVRNAVEAMEHVGQRRLEIRARCEGRFAEISVHDNGPGIPAEVLPTIFDSFVSTKANGMGVGLAISQTIVEAHQGRLSVHSEPGRGTVFSLTIPLARGSAERDNRG